MEDRRVFWGAIGISLLLHLFFLLLSLVITVLMTQEIPEFIEMSYGRPQLVATNTQMIRSIEQPASQQTPVENPSTTKQTTAPTQQVETPRQQVNKPAQQVQPRKTESSPQKQVTPSNQATTPVKMDPAPAKSNNDEQVVIPPKKFDAQDRFKNQEKRLTGSQLLDGKDKNSDVIAEAGSDVASTTSILDKEKETGVFTNSDTEKNDGTNGSSLTGPSKPGPTVPSGNSDLPYQILSDLKNRKIISRPFPKRVDDLTKDSIVEIVFSVKSDGTVFNIRPVKKGDPVLEQVSMDAFKNWLFEPTNNPDPLEVRIRVYSKLQ